MESERWRIEKRREGYGERMKRMSERESFGRCEGGIEGER